MRLSGAATQRLKGEILTMKQYTADKIRNVALAGHSSAGKTSLAEMLLFKSGATDRLGKIADGNTVCDFDPEEIKRQVSVSSAIAPFDWNGVKINLLDTPGMFDFAAGVSEGIRAAETVLLVVSAKDGVGVGTEKAYRLATRMNKSKAFFINKLDVEHADFYKTFEGIKEVFGNSVCPVIIPHMDGDVVDCYIDLVDEKAYKFDPKANKLNEIAIPAAAADRIEEMKMALNEAVAETDDALMEKFFMEEPFTKEEIQKKLVGRGGAVAYFGTNSMLDVENMANDGNELAQTFLKAYVLNICKYIAAMSATADGKIDAILLTGGIAHSKMLMDAIKAKIGFIAPVEVFPGEDEINSLAENGYMILSGQTKVHTYNKDRIIED